MIKVKYIPPYHRISKEDPMKKEELEKKEAKEIK
jgi:hypothetical protein